jgi:hypothetical protein
LKTLQKLRNMEDNNHSTDEPNESKNKTLKNCVTVSVTELSCTTCANAIEKQVKKLRGVSEVKAAVMLNKSS